MYQTLRGNWIRVTLLFAAVVVIGVLARPVLGVPLNEVGRAPGAILPEPQFATGSLAVSANSGEAIVFVTLPAPAPGPVSVGYATQDGSAKAGRDYVASSGTLTFPAGTQVQAVRVQLLNNSNGVMATKSLTLSLGKGGSSTKVTVLPTMQPAVCLIDT